jgi:serine/threonine-protein kinase RsbT
MLPSPPSKTIAIRAESDIVAARKHARELAASLGFDLLEQVHLATAVSELARNALEYAGGGEMTVTALQVAGRAGIELVCRDEGPGISDLARVLEGGYSSGRGLGRGVSGSRALMDEFEIQTAPGRGTTIQGRKWSH